MPHDESHATVASPARRWSGALPLRPAATLAALASLLCCWGCDSDSGSGSGGAHNGGGSAGTSSTTSSASGGMGGGGSGGGTASGGSGGTANGGSGGTAVVGELIWSFDAGDLDKATYDAYLTTMPLGAAGRPQPDSNQFMLALPTPPWHYQFAINYEVPTMEADLRVRTILPADSQNPHNMFRARNSDKLLGGGYTKMQQPYKFEFEADFSAATAWQDVTWCIFFQIWGAQYPSSWVPPQYHARNPPIALSLDGGEFEIRVYGEHTTDLESVTNNTSWTHADSANWTYTPGKHFFEVWVTSDYRLSADGGIGSVRVDMDGTTVYDNDALVNAIYSQIDGQDSGGFPMFGAYSYVQLPAPTHPDITFDRVKIYELD